MQQRFPSQNNVSHMPAIQEKIRKAPPNSSSEPGIKGETEIAASLRTANGYLGLRADMN